MRKHETTLALAGFVVIALGGPALACAILWAACRLLEAAGLLW